MSSPPESFTTAQDAWADSTMDEDDSSLDDEHGPVRARSNRLSYDMDHVESTEVWAGEDEMDLPRPDTASPDDSASEQHETQSQENEERMNRGIPHQASPRERNSPDSSLSIPDDTPSIHESTASSPANSARNVASSPARSSRLSPLRPFDRRLQPQRQISSSFESARSLSPAFLPIRSRQSSVSSQALQEPEVAESSSAPWEVIRWTRLKKITVNVFSEAGRRNFGKPTCLCVSASIVVGTSKGIILTFDYHQNIKSISGPGTKAVESGGLTSIAISADHSTVAGGHASGNIFTWDIARPARPLLHISPLTSSQLQSRKADGHPPGVAVLHLGFLGIRHTAIVSADDGGMAFSHLASRGLGVTGKSVKTQRILGRYPDDTMPSSRPRKPSSVLAFAPLPLSHVEQATDIMGLVAMLTPYLLVIVSTTPVAQTQHKVARPKEMAAHSALSGCLAWFPSVKLKTKDPSAAPIISQAKLVYCWSNILTVLDLAEKPSSEPSDKDRPPMLSFSARSRWKAEEAIVAVQWLNRSVLSVLTITQQLVLLEDNTMRVTETFDLLSKHIFHQDTFSRQLQPLVEQLDEDDSSLHGVVADAFYTSFRAHKGRIFLLGFNDLSVGTLSNWADRLIALMENDDFIGAIRLATQYYTGKADRLVVGLPEDKALRQSLVEEKLFDMLAASLRFAFGEEEVAQLDELCEACFAACIAMEALEFLFDDVYEAFESADVTSVFFEVLERNVLEEEIDRVPPVVLKDLVGHFTAHHLETRLEAVICHLDTTTMDIDQITTLCKKHRLYDALIYVWNQALSDYTTPLIELLVLMRQSRSTSIAGNGDIGDMDLASSAKVFPYLSSVLTSHVYPTGEELSEAEASKAKTELYSFIFAGRAQKDARHPALQQLADESGPSYPYLRIILEYDAASFLSVLNEGFEDGFLNGAPDRTANGSAYPRTDQKRVSTLTMNRQYIINILLEVMDPDDFPAEDTIYLDMFIARNLPKFPQFILLSGSALRKAIASLCQYPSDEIAEDCQLSVEYLLSIHHPSDTDTLVPLFRAAGFFRVLKSLFRSDKRYAQLLQTYFEDPEDKLAVFDCIGDCLRSTGGAADERRIRDVKDVLASHAKELVEIDVTRTAKVLDTYASDLHETILNSLEDDHHSQFIYLQTLLEPATDTGSESTIQTRRPVDHLLTERYVRLLCEHDSSHVATFIRGLQPSDLRLEEVLPAMEDHAVVDAAVVLLAREGQMRNAMDRLLSHLGTLEAALLGLLKGINDSPDMSNTQEAIDDLMEALQRYTGVGTWLCRRKATASQVESSLKRGGRVDTGGPLSSDEQMWLDLIDTIVRIVTHALSVVGDVPDADDKRALSPTNTELDYAEISNTLRAIVQQVFTGLLTTTATNDAASMSSSPSPTPHSSAAPSTSSNNISFLKIFRAFLSHTSTFQPPSSPSSSTLSSKSSPAQTPSPLLPILSSIFAAYTYEESLLSLATSLLDKDLFLNVEQAATLRQRGWKPARQVCEACGKRVWGPGAGTGVWDAWKARKETREESTFSERLAMRRRAGQRPTAASRREEKGKGSEEAGHAKGRPKGKRKDVAPENNAPENNDDGARVESSRTAMDDIPLSSPSFVREPPQPVIIFSCRHLFHRSCLERLQSEGKQERRVEADEADEEKPRCPLCN
ncbi:MAG: Vacuolar protein sorting-associated protein 8 [Caeruleum heppii]|nr:MAG: Vacuolar protein sorting-associated protein 8 [Caeruleum heppii]